MEIKKSKVFTRKLISLVLAVVMAVSGFFGVAFSAQAYQKQSSTNNIYNDSALSSNLIAWVDATDDQTLEALLDNLDDTLANINWQDVNDATAKLDINSMIPSYVTDYLVSLSLTLNQFPYVKINASTSGKVSKSIAGVDLNINIEGRVDSIDGIIHLLFDVKDALDQIKKVGNNGVFEMNIPAVGNVHLVLSEINRINLDVFGNYFHESNGTGAGYMQNNSFRDRNDAKYILKGLIKLIYDNYNNGDNSVLKDILNGSFNILPNSSALGNAINIDLYSIGGLDKTLGMGDWAKAENGNATYQNGKGMAYNILKSLIVRNVPIYDEKSQLKEDNSWVYDSEAYKIINYYLQKISFEITYPNRVDFGPAPNGDYNIRGGDGKAVTGYREDSSKRRYQQALAANKVEPLTKVQKGIDAAKINADYAKDNGWDPNLVYSTGGSYAGNVIITMYGNDKFQLNADSPQTLQDIVLKALPFVWKTAIKDTITLLHVNYDRDKGSGTNFDNAYYYFVTENGGWKRDDWTSNYTEANFQKFLNAKYAEYGFKSADAFRAYIKENLSFGSSRIAKKDKYNWRDIDASILFQEIRYSPLADKIFDMQTGPLNLYFMQTGAENINKFFDESYSNSNTIISQIDDGLIAAVKDFFPSSKNIGQTVDNGDGTYSVNTETLSELKPSAGTTSAAVVSDLITDAATVLQYVCDTTDENLLEAFYQENGSSAELSEDNVEGAMVPFIISALKHWHITASIHNSDWDKVNDLESMAIVSLQEYLKYIYPDRDYSNLWTTTKHTINGTNITYDYIITADSNKNLVDTAIIPMAGDALAFVLNAAGVPVYVQESNNSVKTEGYNKNTGSAELLDPYKYTFVGKGEGTDNLIFQTLNGALCYYAVDKGLAGLVNLEGEVTKSNTIWQNVDNIINDLLPFLPGIFPDAAVGTKVDSKTFVMEKVVAGLSDVGSNKLLSNIFTYIGDIFTCNEVVNKTAFNAVIFDVITPVANRLLGSRNATESNVITVTSETANPIDTFLNKSTLVDSSITNLVNNLYDVLFTNNTSYGPDSYKAITSALNALHIVPKISDNRIGGVEASLTSSVSDTTAVDTKLNIRNASWGFASFYKDKTGAIQQRSRYDATLGDTKIYDENGNDVTSSFTIAADTSNQYASYKATGALPAESYTRLSIKGTAPSNNTLYTVVVNYSMAAKDGSVSYDNLKAVDYLYVGATDGAAWTEAFSGKSLKDDAPDTLVSSTSVNSSLTLKSADYIGLGANAGSAGYTYSVSNTGSESSVINKYVTVAANTPNYYQYVDESFEPSTDADPSSVYVAVDTSGYVLKKDGTKVLASELAKTDATGYILEDGKYKALAISTDNENFNDYKLGTALAGVYLNIPDEADVIPAGTADAAKSAGAKIVSSDSENGLEPAYAPMTVNVTVGGSDVAFTTILSTGDLDSAYSSYKAHAKGLTTHYATSTDTAAYNKVKSALIAAQKSTVSAGINKSNIAENIDIADTDEALLKTASENETAEIKDLKSKVIEARRDRANIDYQLPSTYEKAVDIAQEAEGLVTGIVQTTEETKDGETVKVPQRDANGNEINKYYSYAPSIKIREGIRSYTDIYEPQAVATAFNAATSGKLVVDEVAHATSKVDATTDKIVASTANAYTDFTAAENTTRGVHQFAYSTADDDLKQYDTVKAYDVTVTKANPTVRFGSVDPSTKQLVNKDASGNKIYTTSSWNAYVDALGECINAINNKENISKTYEARSHLVMAENNLTESTGDEPEEPTGDNITISGIVYIARDVNGASGTYGARGVKFKVGDEYVTDASGAVVETSSENGHYGEFSISVPKGTTEIVVTSDSSIDRTVTLSGTSDISNAKINLITVDYTKDLKVNVADFTLFNKQMGGGETAYDLNNDGKVNIVDYLAMSSFMNKTISYNTQSLD